MLFLFQTWNVNTETKYVFAVLGAFAMGLLNQAFVSGRQAVAQADEHSRIPYLHIPIIKRMIVALIYGAHMVLAYWMMLLVMLYESTIFSALIVGLTVGYAIGFQDPVQKKKRSVNRLQRANDEMPLVKDPEEANSTPCCSHASM
jgi:copper transporter 1